MMNHEDEFETNVSNLGSLDDDNRDDDTANEKVNEKAIFCKNNTSLSNNKSPWVPSGNRFRDLMFFVGPGWMVAIAYVDPGNYQADILAGAQSRYSLLCIFWWTSMLSIYVQILCVRLTYYSGMTLAEAQVKYGAPNRTMRYLNWFIAELSTVITDLPEVIGIGIACNIFFGWPYYVGFLLSLLTTMVFLMTLHYSTRILELIVAVFVGIMAVALIVEMRFVGVDTTEMLHGWAFGVSDLRRSDIFAVTGVIGSVVMPHNLYLHTAACQSRSAQVHKDHVQKAVFWSSIEPVLPVIVSFFINLAVVAIAAEKVYEVDNSENVGVTDFCTYFERIAAGCSLWGIALLAAGQSSAITTTYTGQSVMDGFLNLEFPIKKRAIVTRLVAITPCIITSVLIPHRLNQTINIVNASLSFLLPFAFTPLVKLNCSTTVMGQNASRGFEKILLYVFAFSVWLINALGLSLPGGGFFGDLREQRVAAGGSYYYLPLLLIEIAIQLFYAWWNWQCIFSEVVSREMMAVSQLEEFELSGVDEHDEII